MTDRTWGKPPLESSLPHIIVDAKGNQQRPLPGYDIPPFKNRAQATRVLNRLRRKPSPYVMGDPKTWRVEPVRDA